MRKGYRVTLGVLAIMILLTLTMGTSYSYFAVTSEQTNPNQIVSTCFDFELSNEANEIDLGGTNANYAYPITESEATTKLTPYQFTVKNKCTSGANMKYVVTLNTPSSGASTLGSNYLRYRLDLTSPTAETGRSASLRPYTLESSIKTSKNIKDSYLLLNDTEGLGPNESKSYQLYLWIDESTCNGNDCQESVMGKTFNAKLLIYGYM